jgi:hypothetical protein
VAPRTIAATVSTDRALAEHMTMLARHSGLIKHGSYIESVECFFVIAVPRKARDQNLALLGICRYSSASFLANSDPALSSSTRTEEAPACPAAIGQRKTSYPRRRKRPSMKLFHQIAV